MQYVMKIKIFLTQSTGKNKYWYPLIPEFMDSITLIARLSKIIDLILQKSVEGNRGCLIADR